MIKLIDKSLGLQDKLSESINKKDLDSIKQYLERIKFNWPVKSKCPVDINIINRAEKLLKNEEDIDVRVDKILL